MLLGYVPRQAITELRGYIEQGDQVLGCCAQHGDKVRWHSEVWWSLPSELRVSILQ